MIMPSIRIPSKSASPSYGKFTVAGAISLRSRLRGLGTYDGEADFEGILMLGIIIHQG